MYQRGVYRNVLSSTICGSPKLEITQCLPTVEWIYKLSVVIPRNTVYMNENEDTITKWNSMAESYELSVKQKKPDSPHIYTL